MIKLIKKQQEFVGISKSGSVDDIWSFIFLSDKMKYFLSAFVVALISGCSTTAALSLKEHRGDQSRLLNIDVNDCSNLSALGNETAIITFVLDSIQSVFKTAVENKVNRFSTTYTVKKTLPNLSPEMCLKVQRLSSEKKVLLELELKIEEEGAGSLSLVPKSLKIKEFGVSTRKAEKLSANIAVSAGITYVNSNPIQGPNSVTDLVVPIASFNYTLGESLSEEVINNQRSNLIPNLSDRPVNLAVSITEIGNGAGVLRNGLEGFDENAEALRSILGLEE